MEGRAGLSARIYLRTDRDVDVAVFFDVERLKQRERERLKQRKRDRCAADSATGTQERKGRTMLCGGGGAAGRVEVDGKEQARVKVRQLPEECRLLNPGWDHLADEESQTILCFARTAAKFWSQPISGLLVASARLFATTWR